ncbi:ABC transporter substrate-binding protein [Blastococcus haudaquaticus]|uniref:Carbohydrate ABC transporter substrate-binding protein, CUT1 family n=1 Tax=Blastococcus haudaquaticus TaxID=1938745 RepID=A0A286GP37_9ACTN|nr:extracellular solute-binding protein [Blastococcus haudaquaticus]SOD97288.1 carbohydrate ABC transporter substrate-binding protein, CUT1 family [Blastococcus haudaquaticus]
MSSRRLTRAAWQAGALVMAGTLVACGSSGPSGGGGGDSDAVQVWALEDAALNPIEEASIERFNESSDAGEAELATFGNDPYKQRLRVALGSPNAPDLFFNWGGGNLKESVDADQVEDLTPLLDENPELRDAFLPSVLAGAELDGKTYGLPMRGMQPVMLFYNNAVLESAGVAVPETWDDLLAAVDTLKGAGVTPVALAGTQPWTELMWIEYILDRVGGPEVFQAIRDGEEGAWEDPAVLESLTMLRDLIDRGAFGTEFASVGYDVGGASTILAQGDAAFHLMGSWEYTNQLNDSPDFVESGDLGWTTFPAIEGGAGDPSNLVGNVSNFYSLTSSSGNKEAAREFLTTALTDDQYISDLIEAGDVPPVQGVRDQLAETENGDYATFIYDATVDAGNFQLSWDQDLPADEATEMLTQLEQLFLGAQTPQGFVDAMSAL